MATMHPGNQRQNCKSFINALSPERKMRVKFCKYRGKITSFSIQYLVFYGGEWRKIIRIDTKHGVAHRHIFHAERKKHNRREYLGEAGQYNEIYTEWYNKVAKNFQQIENNYFY